MRPQHSARPQATANEGAQVPCTIDPAGGCLHFHYEAFGELVIKMKIALDDPGELGLYILTL